MIAGGDGDRPRGDEKGNDVSPSPFPIETARLTLRALRDDDLDAMLSYRSLESVARYQYWEPHTREMMREALADMLADADAEPRDAYVAAVARRDTGAMIGDVVLMIRDRAARQGEIGFTFHPDHGGHGFATEAASAMMAFGFEALGLHRVSGRCDALNAPSFRLMERLGMRREAHFREHAIFKGRWDEELHYAILEDEWRARPDKES